MHQASFFTREDNGVRCGLCSHHCLIQDGQRGLCSVRENRGGQLFSLNYGKLVARNVDPIEKKPLFHVLPASLTYSISTLGCNFKCRHCQNYSISQLNRTSQITGIDYSPKQVVLSAKDAGCRSISYTYVEPTVFYEFSRDCAQLARENGIKNFFVSNGYMADEPARSLAPVLDGINIDIKGFSEEFYRQVAGAKLLPVLKNVELFASLGVWIEITTLLIEGVNDSEKELKELASFIASINVNIPWHITAFHPAYKMTNIRATGKASLLKARQIGLTDGLKYVYMGNVLSGEENTMCSKCQSLLVERQRFSVRSNCLEDGCCPNCGEFIPGVWR